MMSDKAIKPPLRWAGSKFQLLPALSRFWRPSFERYVEPFAGSATLFFSIAPRQALLSDSNLDLIQTYEALQASASRVLECLLRIPRTKHAYYITRSQRADDLSPYERAARFVYLNAHCFNGLYRTNMNGDFNVPFGRKHRQLPYTTEHLLQASVLLQRATLLCADFEDTLDRTRRGDFVYLDPPYVMHEGRSFVEYGDSPFCEFDLPRLFDRLDDLDRRGASFVVSYADTPMIRKLLGDWNVTSVRAQRNIAGFSGSRKIAHEILVHNFQMA